MSVLVASTLALAFTTLAQQYESFAGFIYGVRVNAIKGQVLYQREDGKFDLETGLRLQESDIIRSSRDAYAELLLQPGNYLRIGGETEFQILSDRHDKMRFKLNQGAISLEILGFEAERSNLFLPKPTYELIRVITPNAQIFIDKPGIFRINAIAGERTELIVHSGEAVINGQRVKQKRRALAATQSVVVSEIDSKLEDSFDGWARERAEISVKANRSLKKQSPWAGKHKQGEEKMIEFPDDGTDKRTAGIISVKPGAVTFFEAGVEVSRPDKEWEQLSDVWEFETGDKLRTSPYSFAELTLFPDTYLRLDSESEILFEQLSNDLISLKLLRGSAILDVARFESKELLPINLAGLSTSVGLVGEGNYRIDTKPSGNRIAVREGKVIFNKSMVSSCRVITGGTVSGCDKQNTDNFDCWSEHRGEGKFYIGKTAWTKASYLAGHRQGHFKKTGFWFQNPGQTDYIFVPFTSAQFRSPYGGNYSTVLAPEHVPINRVDLEDHPMFRIRRAPIGPQ
jgi:hypothetical protein